MGFPKLTPRRVVIVYYACFAIGWLILAAALGATSGSEAGHDSTRGASDAPHAFRAMMLLAAHAACIGFIAWKCERWFFAHGVLAVAAAGLPLLLLLGHLWLVPAFFYAIAEIYVYTASRHESIGKLQAPPGRMHERAPV